MVTQKQKEEIYKLFEQGFTPSQVLIKLNIPAERRIVSGCYTHYKQSKMEEEESLNVEDKFTQLVTQESKEIVQVTNNLKQLLNHFIETGETLLRYVRETNDNYKPILKTREIEFLRQVLLHKIENGDDCENICNQIQQLSKLRRLIKIYTAMSKDVMEDTGKFETGIAKANKTLKNYNERIEGSTEKFVNNRINILKEDTYKQILDEIMEG